MEERETSLRKSRIPAEKRLECLDLFEQGNGYKRTATIQENGYDHRAQHLHRQGLQTEVCSGRYLVGIQDELGKKRVSLPEYFMLLGSAGMLGP